MLLCGISLPQRSGLGCLKQAELALLVRSAKGHETHQDPKKLILLIYRECPGEPGEYNYCRMAIRTEKVWAADTQSWSQDLGKILFFYQCAKTNTKTTGDEFLAYENFCSSDNCNTQFSYSQNPGQAFWKLCCAGAHP